jgi:hypothetical protein
MQIHSVDTFRVDTKEKTLKVLKREKRKNLESAEEGKKINLESAKWEDASKEAFSRLINKRLHNKRKLPKFPKLRKFFIILRKCYLSAPRNRGFLSIPV